MDALDRETERMTANYCRWVVDPGWRDYILDKVDRLEKAKPEWFSVMAARVREAAGEQAPVHPAA